MKYAASIPRKEPGRACLSGFFVIIGMTSYLKDAGA